MNFIIAQIIGLIGTTVNIFSIQLKKKKDIIFWFAIVNFLFAANFLFLESYTGAIICFVAGIQTFIIYGYEKNKKELPQYIIILFMAISLSLGISLYEKYIDILPLISSILYTLSIIQKKEKNIRIITFINITIWIIYDLFVGAYTAGISDIFFLISGAIAIIRYDIIKIINKDNIKMILDEFTLNGNIGFLTTNIFKLKNTKFMYSSYIEDEYWNYICSMKVKNKSEFKAAWEESKKIMLEKDRMPVLYVTPSTSFYDNEKDILPKYMKLISEEVWMTLDNFKNIDDISDAKINIKIDNNPPIEVFTNTFMESYSAESEEDPYGQMPEYYKEAVNNNAYNKTKYKRTYYVAYHEKEPIAVTLTVEKDNIALIAFVGTILKYRKKGVCKGLMKHVLKELKEKNIKLAFLQTEKDFIPEKIYQSIGFKTVVNGKIYADERDEEK